MLTCQQYFRVPVMRDIQMILRTKHRRADRLAEHLRLVIERGNCTSMAAELHRSSVTSSMCGFVSTCAGATEIGTYIQDAGTLALRRQRHDAWVERGARLQMSIGMPSA